MAKVMNVIVTTQVKKCSNTRVQVKKNDVYTLIDFFVFSDLDTWTVSGIMYESKTDAGCTISNVPEMVMTGGNFAEASVWYTSDGESLTVRPPMPLGLDGHCAVALDGNDLFISGGSPSGGGSSSKTFLYRPGTMEWEQLPDMPTSRYNLMCGAVRNEDGAQEVVVAGGGDNVEDVVEIFNVQDGQWRAGMIYFPEGKLTLTCTCRTVLFNSS